MNHQLAFVVDTTKCINCKTCEIACKEIHGAGSGVRMRRVRSFECGEVPSTRVINVSMSCNHCENPVCAVSCPATAYHKRSDGIVVHNPERCIGCRYCTWVCPYGAPQYDCTLGCIRKCDLCIDQLDLGKAPACVEACPTRAIAVTWLDEIDESYTIEIPHVPGPQNTLPGTRYRLRKLGRYE